MKRITITCILVASIFTLRAQDVDLKGALSFGTEVNPGLGLHLGAQYQLNDEVDLAGALTFYLPDKEDFPSFNGTTEQSIFFWMFDADAHYLFEVEDGFNVYPLAGINITGIKVEFNDEGDTDAEIGLNLGGGVEYAFDNQFKGFGEVKYIISQFDQAVINLGVLYTIRN